MGAEFAIDLSGLLGEAQFEPFVHALEALRKIDSSASFNAFCRTACDAWPERFRASGGETSERFARLLRAIEQREGAVIPTRWGGVVVTLHEHPRVEKYLVIRRGGYLALELHEEKIEELEVCEGAGLLLVREEAPGTLRAHVLRPGATFHFEPRVEHCIIGAENLLIFERSIDPKGMDQDLIFLYEPEPASAGTPAFLLPSA